MLLWLLGCAGWVERPYACEFDVLDWWEADPAWLLARAAEDDDGTWQFDTPSSRAAIEHTEGYYDPEGERLAFTEWYTEASSHARVDVTATGRVEQDGDLDLVAQVYSYDELGFLAAWTESMTRDGCAMERTATVEGATEPNVYTYTFVDDDTVAGTWAYAWEGSDVSWEETSTLTSDLVRTAHAGYTDGSYTQSSTSWPTGESEIDWEDHTYEPDYGVVYRGAERYEIDGTRHADLREERDGVLVKECQLTESYAGTGTATCYEPDPGRTCALSWDTEACSATCDDGDTYTC